MKQLITKTPIGKIAISYESDYVLKVDQVASQSRVTVLRDSFAKEINRQLQAYFSGNLNEFSIPYLFESATDYQMRVWEQIGNIPFGATKTYGEIANRIKSGPRAVGNACRRNQLLLIIPCHRVVSVNGLGGFMGDASGKLVRRKEWLLNHEQSFR